MTPEREGGIEVREIKREQCDMGLGLFDHKNIGPLFFFCETRASSGIKGLRPKLPNPNWVLTMPHANQVN